MPKLIVDGHEVEVPADYTLLQACEQAGAEVPRFCFHERLSVAGNCRMCLVEVKGMPKPQASCALGVRDLRPGPNGEPPVVNTNTPIVKKAREGVMEFLLINHPLDCPICDQGGECDLQDQAIAFGIDSGRYAENKRAVEDKDFGALVKTTMTRCIHCTRCVRFMTEVAGVPELGAISRGEDMEVTTYLDAALSSELQGNVIDLCPVGALTSRPYAYQARPWELNKTESVDVMDALGSAIRVDTRGREVMRILPRLNEDVNEEWISDKTRFIWDGLRTQRLDKPYVRVGGRLEATNWPTAFAAVKDALAGKPGARIGALVGDLAGVEETFALKELLAALGSSNIDCRQDGAALDPANGRASYLFNPGVAGIDEADAILLIGTNPRLEAPVLNARIRKRWRNARVPVGVVGAPFDATYDIKHLGSGADTLNAIIDGSSSFAEVLKKAEKPLIIVGQGALAREDGAGMATLTAKLAQAVGAVKDGWNGYAVLHTAAARVGALDIGAVPGEGGLATEAMLKPGALDVLVLLGADEVEVPAGAFVIYIGTHGDRGAHRADVILPAAAYTEKSATYVSTEGRVQVTGRASFPPGEAKEDWAILRALSAELGKTLPFDSLGALRAKIFAAVPHLAAVDAITPADAGAIATLAAKGGATDKTPICYMISDFYLTNPIARASAVMADCSANAKARAAIAAE